jgi:hypothetical protein
MNRADAVSSLFGRPAWQAVLCAFALCFLVAVTLTILIGIVARSLSRKGRLSWQ